MTEWSCSQRWRPSDRPCGWFRGGTDCNRNWMEFTAPTNSIIIAVAYANLIVLACLVAGAFSRRRVQRSLRKKKMWTAYEHTAAVCLVAFAAQAVAISDLANYWLREWRVPVHCLVRYCFELAIFITGFAFQRCLRNDNRWQRLGVYGLTFSFTTAACAWGVAGVAPSQRPACTLAVSEILRNWGASTIEVVFCLKTAGWAIQMRRQLIDDRQTVTRFSISTTTALDVMEARIFTLFFVAVAVAVSLAVTFAREANETGVFCLTPTCSSLVFVTEKADFVWAYLVVDWLCVLFLVAPTCFVQTIKRSSFDSDLGFRHASWTFITMLFSWHQKLQAPSESTNSEHNGFDRPRPGSQESLEEDLQSRPGFREADEKQDMAFASNLHSQASDFWDDDIDDDDFHATATLDEENTDESALKVACAPCFKATKTTSFAEDVIVPDDPPPPPANP